MRRGTTPTFFFELPADATHFLTVEIVFVQDGKTVLTVDRSRLTANGRQVSFRMTEEETLSFLPEVNAELQLRLITEEGQVLVSDIRTCPIRKKYPEDLL